jgi:hypothetical protein
MQLLARQSQVSIRSATPRICRLESVGVFNAVLLHEFKKLALAHGLNMAITKQDVSPTKIRKETSFDAV